MSVLALMGGSSHVSLRTSRKHVLAVINTPISGHYLLAIVSFITSLCARRSHLLS